MHTAEQIAEAIKQEVMAGMVTGKFPELPESYSELHDYCDANMLGDELWGEGDYELTDELIAILDNAHEIVDHWLKARRGALDLVDSIPLDPELDEWYNPILRH